MCCYVDNGFLPLLLHVLFSLHLASNSPFLLPRAPSVQKSWISFLSNYWPFSFSLNQSQWHIFPQCNQISCNSLHMLISLTLHPTKYIDYKNCVGAEDRGKGRALVWHEWCPWIQATVPQTSHAGTSTCVHVCECLSVVKMCVYACGGQRSISYVILQVQSHWFCFWNSISHWPGTCWFNWQPVPVTCQPHSL